MHAILDDREPARGRSAHLLGVLGQGQSALAGWLIGTGTSVTGQDKLRPDPDDPLHQVVVALGIDVTVDARSVPGSPGVVVPASYVPSDHPALADARQRRIPVIPRLAMLQQTLTEAHDIIAVAGGTGKSTTTAVMHQLLRHACEAGIYVAAACPHLDDRNYEVTAAGPVVVEACEFRREFLALRPAATVVTNVLWGDHADYYASAAEMHDAFAELLARSGLVVVNADDHELVHLTQRVVPARAVTVGERAGDWRFVVREMSRAGTVLDLVKSGAHHRLSSPLVGRHNAANLALAAAACLELGYAPGLSASTSLQVPRRRVEPIATSASGGVIVDDYAHNPAQIAAGLASVRLRWPDRRLVCVFQPSVHSRVLLQFEELVQTLGSADEVGMLPIQNGSLDDERDQAAVRSEDLIAALTAAGCSALLLKDGADATTFGVTASGHGDVVYVAGSRRAAQLARSMAAAAGTQAAA